MVGNTVHIVPSFLPYSRLTKMPLLNSIVIDLIFKIIVEWMDGRKRSRREQQMVTIQ